MLKNSVSPRFRRSVLSALLTVAALGTAVQAQTYYIVALAKLGGSAGSQPTISVSLTSYSLPRAVSGEPYTFDLNALLSVKGDPKFSWDRMVWSLVGDSALPAGLVLGGQTGIISGAATGSGASQFKVVATYGDAQGTQTYTIAVDMSVVLRSAILPESTIGESYTFDFRSLLSVAGDPQYDASAVKWTSSPAWPKGLSFQGGVLSGTPSLIGSTEHQVEVSYKGSSAGQRYTIAIGAPKPYLLANGVTVRCLGLPAGQEFLLNGKTYRVVYSVEDAKTYAAIACTSNMNYMGNMSFGATFNENISHWDTANVTSMSFMFGDAWSFNQPIDNWDVSKVMLMDYMFYGASAFNQPIGNWDVSGVFHMDSMFTYASAFNQPIGNWDTAELTSTAEMFSGAQAFNQPIENWNTSKVTDMNFMFYEALAFNRQICGWNVGGVTSFEDFKTNSVLSDGNAPKFSDTAYGDNCP